MEKFVHEEEPTVDELRRALRRATLDTQGDKVLAPVLCGSAFKNKGVQPLLDAIVTVPALAAGRARRSAGPSPRRARRS